MTSAQSAASDGRPAFPGERLGLPASGARSVARLARRIGAICIDWAIAYGLAFAFFRTDDGTTDGLAISIIFLVMQVVFVTFAAGSIGHLILGMRVVPLSGGWVGFLRPAARAILLTIVIPAVIWDADQRGLHDRLAGTVLVRG